MSVMTDSVLKIQAYQSVFFTLQSTLSEKISTEGCKEGQMIRSCFTVSPLAVNEDTGAALVQVTVNKGNADVGGSQMNSYVRTQENTLYSWLSV